MAWHSKEKRGYAISSYEAHENALEIYGILSSRGWTLNAICALLGNIGSESGYNPWRWQGDRVGKSSGSPWTNKGYGLTQFTPASKYINEANAIMGYAPNFSDKAGNSSDGYSQMLYLNDYADYYATTAYPISYSDFKSGDFSVDYLAKAWLYNYERPKDPQSTESQRVADANYWCDVLSGVVPPTPIPPSPPTPSFAKKRGMPIWMMMKR